MEICIKYESVFEERIFFRQGFFYFYHHVNESPYFGGIIDERCTGIDVLIVRKTRTDACALFHVDMVAGGNISLDVVRCKSHAELVVLDLFYASDLHVLYSSRFDCSFNRTFIIIKHI